MRLREEWLGCTRYSVIPMHDYDAKTTYQKRIKEMADRLIEMFHWTDDERRKLAEWVWLSGNEQSPNIEAFIHLVPDYVAGYASTIAYRGIIKDARKALENLNNCGLHNHTDFRIWFVTEGDNYEKIREYVLYVDYLRLMVMDYIRLFLTADESTPV